MAQVVLEPSTNVLVTGATGLIGGEIVRKLGSLGLGRILALIRPRDGVGPEERLRHRLRRSCRHSEPSLANVQAIEGDITSPHWGLSTADLERVTRSVDLIVHNAADTSFAAHRNTHLTNVAGTRNLIELAHRCQRRPLIVFMSTASNSGKAAHVCLAEHEGCRPDNEHFNDYTQSKAVSEMMLHDSGLPVLTLRPTIVLSAGLADPGFARQILWCVPLTRVFKALPIDPASRLDVVDVNFVVEATLRLLAKGDRRYDCYNLSAGLRNAVTVGEAGDAVARHYRRTAALQLVPPEHWKVAQQRLFVRSPLQRKTFRALRHYFPFLNMDVVYDDRRLREELGAQMPPVRPLTEYIGDLLRVIRAKAALEEAAYP